MVEVETVRAADLRASLSESLRLVKVSDQNMTSWRLAYSCLRCSSARSASSWFWLRRRNASESSDILASIGGLLDV